MLAAAMSLAVHAQALPRVAVVYQASPEADANLRAAFSAGMRERGHVPGKTVILDEVTYLGRYDRLPDLLKEVLARKPSVLVVSGSVAAQAAKAATSTVPIVLATASDPVGQGLVKSLAVPGGNITGNTILAEMLATKRLELLKELLPKAVEIAWLNNSANPVQRGHEKAILSTAKRLGVRMMLVSAASEAELDQALASLPAKKLDALLLGADGTNRVYRAKIVAALAAQRLPAMPAFSDAAIEGGLISYASNTTETYRNAASFVDRILKGAKPGELPMEQPTKFEMVVNLKTARALGLTVPQSILLPADRVIE